ncbi:DciA family protein [Streptomyces sp. NPDC048331]|uniref:DciA family protein n=1 Tax=Streptomyces sp. NPDC048331 TaxID=3365534 RepID=UPI0037111F06
MEQHQDLARLALWQARQDARWRRGERASRRRSQPGAGPVLLRKAFSDLLSERGWMIPAVHPLFTSWPDIVGPEIAAHVTVVDVDGGGRFIVRADSKAWASQMRLLAPQLVARLNLDHAVVRALQVLSPQDPQLPVEKAPLWRRAGLVSGAPASGTSDNTPQPSDGEPSTPFYAPPSPPETPPTAQDVHRLALARARASKRS